jgi:hypothetical protein
VETQKVVEDVLLSSENKDWMRRVFLASHVISDKFLDIYSKKDRNYFEGTKFNFVELEQGLMSKPDVLTIVDRIISVYLVSNDPSPRNTRKVLSITGHDSQIKQMSRRQFQKTILAAKGDYSFLQDGEYKVLYFPYHEATSESPNDYDFYLFREISKNRFLINSLSNNLSEKDLVIREGFTRRDVIDMVIDTIWGDETEEEEED